MNAFRTLLSAALLTSPALAQTPCAWQAEGNLIVVEVESAAPTASWTVETEFDGYSGSSYYRWSGSNHFSNPGNGIMTYTLDVHEEGRYELRIHNRHEHADHTEENDCWVRMDGGEWIKLYSNGSGTVSNWNWKSRFEIHGSHSDAGWDLSVGRHEFQISGRSHGFMIDRFNFYKGNPAGHSNVATEVSPCALGGNFCTVGPNSSGSPARISATGSLSVADNAFRLVAAPLPASSVGIFYFGVNAIDTPFGNGRRCVGGQTYRLPFVHASGGTLEFDLSFTQGRGTVITPGSTWRFQAWFRDVAAGGAGYDTSDGLNVNFLP